MCVCVCVHVDHIIHNNTDLIETHQCVGREAEVRTQIAALQDQWHTLVARSAEKTQKLREANQQQRFNEGIKELDFWLEEMEAKMESDEMGKDLSSVEALMKKHQQLEADMKAHEVRTILHTHTRTHARTHTCTHMHTQCDMWTYLSYRHTSLIFILKHSNLLKNTILMQTVFKPSRTA